MRVASRADFRWNAVGRLNEPSIFKSLLDNILYTVKDDDALFEIWHDTKDDEEGYAMAVGNAVGAKYWNVVTLLRIWARRALNNLSKRRVRVAQVLGKRKR